jgi:hypothetical protein
MSTFLKMLRLAFWVLPMQRWCTVLGGILMVTGIAPWLLRDFVEDPYLGRALDRMAFGQLLVLGIPALLGGAVWRALSAPRRIGLAPHGRARLLFAAFGVAVLIAALLVASYVLFDLNTPALFRMGPNAPIAVWPQPIRVSFSNYGVMFVGAFATATWWAIASFIASRSPLAMLIVVVACIGSIGLLDKLGIDGPRAVWIRPWGAALPLSIWFAFGLWYVRARRIAPPGWLLPGGQSVIANAATPDAGVAVLPHQAAMERLLLGGASVPRMLLQWLCAGALLLFLLMLMAWRSEGDAMIVAHVAFAALIACPAIVAVQSVAIVQRARALWLPSGYSRSELFAFTERTLLKFALGMALVFSAFLLLLWYTQPWRPSLTLVEALLVMLLPSLQLATHAMTASRGWDFYWRWPLVMLLCWFIAWKPLTSTDPVSWVGPRGWLWFLLAGVATFSFHVLARRRWLRGDLPRLMASP